MKKPYKLVDVGYPNILALEFKATIPMTVMFMRFQEFTEGYKTIRSRLMPEGNFLYRYWKKFKNVYYKAGWAGFNIKGSTLDALTGIYGPSKLNELEADLLNIVRDRFPSDSKYFVIAYTKGDKITRKHEIHHAIFYLNRTYRKKVSAVLESQDLTKATKYLKKLGYYTKDPYIVLDEIHAYALEDNKKTNKALGLNKKTLKALQKLSKQYV